MHDSDFRIKYSEKNLVVTFCIRLIFGSFRFLDFINFGIQLLSIPAVHSRLAFMILRNMLIVRSCEQKVEPTWLIETLRLGFSKISLKNLAEKLQLHSKTDSNA